MPTLNYPYLTDHGSTIGLADDLATISTYTTEIDPAERERAAAVLATAPAISLHDHPTRLPDPMTAETWATFRGAGRAYHGFDGLARSEVSAFFVNAWSFAPAEMVLAFLGRLRADVSHRSGFFVADGSAELARTRGAGGSDGVALYLSLESATAFDDQPGTFEQLYGLGVRMAGLCYNDGNAFGCGLGAGDGDTGLTAAGRDLVRRFNDLGIIVDLGHVGDQTSLDAIEASSKPVVISHAGCRGLWDTPRMKPDSVLRALAGNGGVLGISAAPNTTRSTAHPAHSIDSFMDHLFHAVDLIGIDHVGLGPDTMFGDHARIHALGRGDGQWGQHSGRELGGLVPFVDGVENPAETFRNVVVYLQRAGWAIADIHKIVSGNAERVLREVLAG